MSNIKVAVVMGSSSDWEVMKEAVLTLVRFGIEVHREVVSAHRNPSGMNQFANSARKNGFSLIIAGAGGSAHLPGMVAAQTSLPVIGVPIQTKALNGLDSLLSIVQMPKGIPVATVAINGSENAAHLALRILGVGNSGLLDKVEEFQSSEASRSIKQTDDLK